ncbi:MAG: arabinan endo-1,5-alpha-L-arabinosidase [Chitinispirillaceae bacterium]|nr:arabinan endo-1,5-alpha-L-arabinosidase [Chitinispirillaceae bacterium]
MKSLSSGKIFLFFFVTFSFAETKEYINQLKGDITVHDPAMTKSNGVYYIFYTGDYIPIKISTDRIKWNKGGVVFKKPPSWFNTYVPENDGKNCWAPDISFRDGKFWLYYSVSTFGKKVSAIGLATNVTLDSTSPMYNWKDEGVVINSTDKNDYNCIDPNVFTDTDGRVWLIFGSWWTGIKMVELNSSTGKLISSNPTIYSLAKRINNSGIEAPFIVKRGDYYYLFVSWDVCCKGVESTYNIRVGRASKITGPYVDKNNVQMTNGGGTLIDDGDERWIGPGHNAIFVENDTFFLVNHAYDARDNGTAKLMIRPLYWDKDGWPSLDSTKGQITTVNIKKSIKPLVYKSKIYRVFLNSESHINFKRCYNLRGKCISERRKAIFGIYIVEK